MFLPVGLTQSASPSQFIIIASADREKEAELKEESKTDVNGEGKGAVLHQQHHCHFSLHRHKTTERKHHHMQHCRVYNIVLLYSEI